MTEISSSDYSSESDPTYDSSLTGEFAERFDLEVADDLGIATDHESLQRQIESGKEVGRLTIKNTVLGADGGAGHAIVEAEDGVIKCGDCSKPGCPGCGGR